MAEATRWGRWGWASLLALGPLAAAGLVGVTLARPAYNEPFFVHTAYYALLLLLGLYLGVRLSALDAASLRAWAREHAAGLVVAGVVTAIAVVTVEPGFRVLADEANLVGVSKHLYHHRVANFPITGKWYFENYWTLSSTTDRRPALYPFLVSLLHLVRGYHVENAFHVNAAALLVLVFASYRLAKGLGGELFGLASALLVGAHANVLIAARSAGFDLLATCMLVVSLQSYCAASREPTPRRVAVTVLHLCLFANVRYEGTALLLLGGLLLVATRVVTRASLAGFGWLYSTLPLLLLPRYWQSIAKADDAEQPLSASLFGFGHFWQNAGDFLGVLRDPLDVGALHAPLVMALAFGGLALLAVQGGLRLRARAVTWHGLRVALFIAAFFGTQVVLYFSYFWGRPLHPASVRLFLWLDVGMSLLAAWLLAWVGQWVTVPVAALGRRAAEPVPLALAAALFSLALPTATEARLTNSLTLTRQTAMVWRYLASLDERRILVLTDRPGMYTIHDYGALDISTLRNNRQPLFELSRRLFEDIYLVQEVDLNTRRAPPKFDPWPDVATETVLEFQNTDSVLVRIARVKRPVPASAIKGPPRDAKRTAPAPPPSGARPSPEPAASGAPAPSGSAGSAR